MRGSRMRRQKTDALPVDWETKPFAGQMYLPPPKSNLSVTSFRGADRCRASLPQSLCWVSCLPPASYLPHGHESWFNLVISARQREIYFLFGQSAETCCTFTSTLQKRVRCWMFPIAKKKETNAWKCERAPPPSLPPSCLAFHEQGCPWSVVVLRESLVCACLWCAIPLRAAGHSPSQRGWAH